MSHTSTSARRVRLVAATSTVRDACKSALEAGHLTVETSSSLRTLTTSGPTVVVCDWSLFGQQPTIAVRQLRSAHPGIRLLVVVDKLAVPEALLDAGVDDFVRVSACRDELVLRLRRLGADVREEEPVLRELERLPLALASDLSGFAAVHLDSEVDVPLPCDFGDLVVARLPMHLAAWSLEIDVYVVTRRDVLERLAHLLGITTVDDHIVDDLARELTNQSAGALKRTCSPAGAQLTMGLPTTVSSTTLPGTGWVTRVSGADLEFSIVVDVRKRPPALVTVDDLREGMVVVGDLRNAAGTLLLGGGSRLTTTLVHRVRAALPAGQRIEILDPQLARTIEAAAVH